MRVQKYYVLAIRGRSQFTKKEFLTIYKPVGISALAIPNR